ncbi:MAG: hypothetical protein EBS83_12030 [Planctomycetia bacterium]|nr:hypothetical protein [Planctomycetia bacterium]
MPKDRIFIARHSGVLGEAASRSLKKPPTQLVVVRCVELNTGKPEERVEGIRFRGEKNAVSLSLRFGLRRMGFMQAFANAHHQ